MKIEKISKTKGKERGIGRERKLAKRGRGSRTSIQFHPPLQSYNFHKLTSIVLGPEIPNKFYILWTLDSEGPTL